MNGELRRCKIQQNPGKPHLTPKIVLGRVVHNKNSKEVRRSIFSSINLYLDDISNKEEKIINLLL